MKIGRDFEFPPEQQEPRRRAARLSWLSMALLLTTAIAVYLTLGQSQAMKTAWIEDLMGLIPPAVLLVALRLENKEPNDRYPFGHFQAISIAFLVTSALLTLGGLWLLYDSAMRLIHRERVPVGTMTIASHTFWSGWAMIAALVYCVAVGVVRLRQVVADLMDETPTEMGGLEMESLPRKLRDAAEQLPWVKKAAVRIRERGHVIAGEVFLVPRTDQDLVRRVEDAMETLSKVDWRIYTLTLMPISELDDGVSPKRG